VKPQTTAIRRYFEAFRWFASAWFLTLAAAVVPRHCVYVGSLTEAAEYAAQSSVAMAE
jgi:hypothetical protein